jgi:hemerythrin-like metal-binding protein
MGNSPRSRDVIARFRRLLGAFREHCAFEEELMEQLGYPRLERHREDHRRHIEEGNRLLRELETRNDGRARKMYYCWESWSVAHYLGEDLEFGRFLRGVRSASS